jgi:hypothetical protein
MLLLYPQFYGVGVGASRLRFGTLLSSDVLRRRLGRPFASVFTPARPHALAAWPNRQASYPHYTSPFLVHKRVRY